MRSAINVTVVVENKPGAGGRLLAGQFKHMHGDGSVYMTAPIVVPVLAPMVYKIDYNPETDLLPVALLCRFGFGLAVRADHPARNIRELREWLRANPGQANFGSPSPGSLPHFFGVMIGKGIGVDLQHIPFNGGGQMQAALLGGTVPLGIDVISEIFQGHRAGKLRILATSGATRDALLPDVPTFAEQGLPSIVGEGWFALYAPPGTAQDRIQRMNGVVNTALKSPELAERLKSLGFEPGGGTPADLAQLQRTDSERWAPVVKASGFHPQ